MPKQTTKTRPGLTARQDQLLNLIFATVQTEARFPSQAEMIAHLGLSSGATVQGYLQRLQNAGWLERTGAYRALRLLRRPDGQPFDGLTFN